MPAFDLASYITVDERIDQFWAKYSTVGSIQTEVCWVADNGSSVAIRATVLVDDRIIATGIAQEEQGPTGANKTSWWENCETSAIGRALANMGMSLSKNRPSREEMEKVERVVERGVARSAQDAAPPQTRQVAPYAPALREPTPKPSPPARPAGEAREPDWTDVWKLARSLGINDRQALAGALGANPGAMDCATILRELAALPQRQPAKV